MYAANAFGFWAKHAPSYLADSASRAPSPLLKGKRMSCATGRSAWSGVIGPWNYPLTNSSATASRRCRGQRGDPQAQRGSRR
jgi:hypothetical protein